MRPVKTRKEKDKIKCIYCSKIYISISCHTKHQNSCQFNPVIAANTNVSAFKSYLPKSGNCPECNQFYSRLPSHFGFCVRNSISDFTKYLHKLQNHQFVNIERVDDFNSLSELPFFDCIDLGDELVEPCSFTPYITSLTNFASGACVNIGHLNINSLNSRAKQFEIDEILNLNKFDLFFLNETKIDDQTRLSIKNSNYKPIRRDRNSNGGGVMVYYRKEYIILNEMISVDFETISFQIKFNGIIHHFIASYKPPIEN